MPRYGNGILLRNMIPLIKKIRQTTVSLNQEIIKTLAE